MSEADAHAPRLTLPLAQPGAFIDTRLRSDQSWFQQRLTASNAAFVVVRHDAVLVSLGVEPSDEVQLFTGDTHAVAALESFGLVTPQAKASYLGELAAPAAGSVFAVRAAEEATDEAIAAALSDSAGVAFRALREVAHLLSPTEGSLAARALALTNWHEEATFSSRTGNPIAPEQAGWVQREAGSTVDHFARIDPAIIVLVRDNQDRILLASNLLWPANRFSLLAGFVEAGESLEAAVHREVFEESGMRLTSVRYQASQPWPFPRSLMIGFSAKIAEDQDPETLVPDTTEIADLRWFTREQLRDTNSDVQLAGRASISRFLIDSWLRGELPVD